MSTEILPSGITVVSGGSRVWPKFNRPWQVPLTVLQTPECPLEVGDPDLELASYDYGNGWRIRKNRFTPFPFHVLVLPRTCKTWSESEIRINSSGVFRYLSFVPILNNWGANDLTGIVDGTRVTMPWPHAVTLNHLKG